MAVNEFRKDIVSGEWVLISSLRAKRPHEGVRERLAQAVEGCVFEPGSLHEQSDPLAVYQNGERIPWHGDWEGPWTTAVINNKFPALQAGVCGAPHEVGPYLAHEAFGFHELVITRDHEQHFAQFTDQQTAEVLHTYRDRYQELAKDACGDYISIFHNHGRAAGASIFHNHSQIITTPFIPPGVLRSLRASDEYFQRHGTPIHQTVIDWERQQGRRVVYENEDYIVLCPFASKTGYEMRLFPKQPASRFEEATDAQLLQCANALTVALRALHGALDDIDYNFYIHTVPVQRDSSVSYDHYRWHVEITPRPSIEAGFEFSTAVHINSFDPDDAAQHLRDVAGAL